MKIMRIALFITFMFCSTAFAQKNNTWPNKTQYHHQQVNGHQIFYREAGKRQPNKPTLVLLHGWPTSSHYFRELIPLLSGRFHIIAPDNLGSGYSDRPDPDSFVYTFKSLADHIEGLLNQLQIDHYVLYMHDFGAPVGFHVMARNPKKVKGIIAQNGNLYEEGFGKGAATFFKQAHDDRSPAHIESLNSWGGQAVVDSYRGSVATGDISIMSPDTWSHDNIILNTKKGLSIQTQLFQDYQNNIDTYPDWQAILRAHQPPTLVIWGKHDPFFIAEGGKAYKNDVPKAKVHMLDAGHYALEEKQVEIAKHITRFMKKIKS